MIDWLVKTDEEILSGRGAGNIPLLQTFLIDYKDLTGATSVNAGCRSCIIDYIRTYKLKIRTMSKTKSKDKKPKFVVKEKYLGAPLGFGTGLFINTKFPSNKEVVSILKIHDAKKIFKVLPEDFDKEKFISKHEGKSEDSKTKTSWQERVKIISTLETIEDVNKALEDETSAKVQEAGEERLKQLSIPEGEK